MKTKQHRLDESDLPTNLSQPALRALRGAGYTRLDQLAGVGEAEIAKLHGMGPRGIDMLRDALRARGLTFGQDLRGPQEPQAKQKAAPNPTIERLTSLVGTWRTEIAMPLDPPINTGGQTTIEWLEQGKFLIQQGSVEHPDFPTGIAIIGADDTNDAYSMLYFDSRGVSRIYEMSLTNKVWRLWREAPDFSQRFTGSISDNGNTITGYWERSTDGSNWDLDFNLTYKKVK